ncbi:MAG TPA: metal-dependent transcriptional regulator [Candidatus Omnitrophota bacterium]|nr:metal-dependent transcriptional regulator [Candidatus Omnitrophota bacterium]
MGNITHNLSSTMEDYLEAIYELKQANGVARVGEIAGKLNVKSSTVNSAIKYLTEQNLVVHEKYGYIALTERGQKLAAEVKSKHDILFRFLTEFLMIDAAAAEKEACCIEHAISQETFIRLTKFFAFLEKGFRDEKPRILELFEVYLKTGKRKKCACKDQNCQADK